jgi:hypothetical protein
MKLSQIFKSMFMTPTLVREDDDDHHRKKLDLSKIFKYNPNHVPAGSPEGGQFTSGDSNARSTETGTGKEKSAGVSGSDSGASERGNKEAIPRSYGRGNRKLSVKLQGQTVDAFRWEINEADQHALNARGIPTPAYLELSGDNAASVFSKSITKAKEANPNGAAVYVYADDDYKKMRLFVTEDGKAGVAIKRDGDIVSVFNTPGGLKGVAFSALHLAVQNGGRKLDAFDTVLPIIYAKAGFSAVSRLKWDDSQAPSNWDKKTFKAFNNGEPDVVFMTYTGRKTPYAKGEGKLVDTYDEAVALQEKAIAKKDERILGLDLSRIFKVNPNPKVLQKTLDGHNDFLLKEPLDEFGLAVQYIKNKYGKAQKFERILDPFESFADAGDQMMQLVSQLHTSRLSAYGFTAEAEVTGVAKYEITEQLDNRICPVCEAMHGRSFEVQDARDSLDQILHVDDPNALKSLQPWPDQDEDSVAAIKEMSDDELVDNNWHIPPYHPFCRGILVPVGKAPKIQHTPSFEAAFDERPEDTLQKDVNQLMDQFGIFMDNPPKRLARFWAENVSGNPVVTASNLVGLPTIELLADGELTYKFEDGDLIMLYTLDSATRKFRFTGSDWEELTDN